MTAHSKEPWRIAGERPEGVVIMSADDRIVAVAVPPHRGEVDAGTRADANRIVAAINACRNLETAELEGSDLGARLYDLGRSLARDAAALGLLRRLVEVGCQEHDGDWIGCFYCGKGSSWDPKVSAPVLSHEPDCPYLAARAFLEGEEGA